MMVVIMICKVYLYGELMISNIFTKFTKYGCYDHIYIVNIVLHYMYNIHLTYII